MPRKRLFKTLGATLGAIAFGVIVGAFVTHDGRALYDDARAFASRFTAEKNASAEERAVNEIDESIKPERITLGNIDDEAFSPSREGKVIRVNLETMELTAYENGTLAYTFPVLAKGKPGSYYETPGGEYHVLLKEDRHLASVGKVWMPYSLQFFGNFFIHGWPYYQGGKELPVGSGFSGGCIRLSTENAKTLFEWADVGTTVSIYSLSELSENQIEAPGYFTINPSKKPPSGPRAYIVGDIDTGEILLSKNADTKYPIASVTKLLTAATALDIVSQRKSLTVSSSDLAVEGSTGDLRVGETIPTNDLIYPLLLESSNDAGETLARFYGRSAFIDQMNEKAHSIGMDTSSFADPTGLSPENMSSAGDLFRLARYIDEYKSFLWDVTDDKTYTAGAHTWYNTSQFLKTPGYYGGKRGYTDPARETNLSVFHVKLNEFDERDLAIVVLGSEDRYSDTIAILNYVKSNIYYGGDESEIRFYTPPPQTPPPTTATLAFAGDVMLDRGVKTSVDKYYAGDFGALFAPLAPLRDADVAFVNLEGPVSDVGMNVGSKYSFRMNPIVIGTLKSAGIDIVSFANNHVGDWSKAAFDDTRVRLAQGSVLYTGAGDTKDAAETPTIIEKNDIRIGFLGFTDVGPAWLEAGEDTSGVLLASDPDREEIIRRAKEDVDFLVVSYHWGEEYKAANDRQKMLAHTSIDAGADLVVGHHPHVIQESEWYSGKYIMYSLGNLIFDQYFSPETMHGLLLEVTIDGEDIVSVKKNLVTLDATYRPSSISDYEN